LNTPTTHLSALSTRTIILIDLIFSGAAAGFLFWLIYFHKSSESGGLHFLPAVNASLNALSAAFLVLGFRAIRGGRISTHKIFMTCAFLTSALFLGCYIVYHTYQGDTHFTGQGFIRPVYFFILISHIVLSVLALPVILYTYAMGLSGRILQHKKIAIWTFSIWLYVSVTGVLIFILLKLFS